MCPYVCYLEAKRLLPFSVENTVHTFHSDSSDSIHKKNSGMTARALPLYKVISHDEELSLGNIDRILLLSFQVF